MAPLVADEARQGERGAERPSRHARGGIVGRSYIETFFRHRLLLVLPLVGFLVGTAFAFTQPREYMATSSVWVDNAVTAGSSASSGGSTPPSSLQTQMLTQYLATRSFLTAVAMNSPRGHQLEQAGPDEADDILAKLAESVSVSTPGPQLMLVSVTTDDARESTETAKALLAQFQGFQMTDLKRQKQTQADYDKSQLDNAAAALTEAERQLQQGRGSASAGRAVGADGAAADAVERARKAYADAATDYATSSRALATGDSTGLFVLDQPDRAWPQSRRKTLVIGAAGGLLAGATLSLLALLALMARDKTLRDEQDAARALSLDVVGAVPLARLETPEVFTWAQAEDPADDPATRRHAPTFAGEPGKAGGRDE